MSLNLRITTTPAQRLAVYRALGVKLNPTQERALLCDADFVIFAGGVGAGKSYCSALRLLPDVLLFDNRLYWIAANTYDLSRVVFRYLMEHLQKLAVPIRTYIPNRGPWALVVEGTGVRVETKSLTEPEQFHAVDVHGLVITEAALCPKELWETRLLPRVTRTGGWVFCDGTFEGGNNWFARAFEEGRQALVTGKGHWRAFAAPSWENVHLYPGGRSDPKILRAEAESPKDVFEERYAAVPAKPSTLVYPEFEFTLHVPAEGVELNPNYEVEVWVDPGYHVYAVLAAQVYGGCVYIIDEVYMRKATAQQVIVETMSRPWWQYVQGGVIDFAGRQHPGMESQVEIWRRMAGIYLRSQPVPVDAGIALTRVFLKDPTTGQPRLFISPRCVNMIWEFGQYRYRPEQPNKPVKEVPIDRDNHALKALAYGLADRFGLSSLRRRNPYARRVAAEGGRGGGGRYVHAWEVYY